ncbi:hypothetical protein HPP92_022443 [Vanilla planifolia]|uniref:Mitochondrial carnitine/acylcarnitine carrier-like protein n=1 Tax=Vanilla planifolia TaxID=51239 RepID=A0A835UFB4_VANPL|nr:hypothetical protein HPP92_022443 [Vanilla planifolia]
MAAGRTCTALPLPSSFNNGYIKDGRGGWRPLARKKQRRRVRVDDPLDSLAHLQLRIKEKILKEIEKIKRMKKPDQQAKVIKMAEVAKDLASGTVGGAAQLIVGHPFDTIKVMLQSQPAPLPGQLPKYSGALDALKKTVSHEGPRSLYKGMGAPLATVAAFNAVLFTVRGQMESLLRSEPLAPLSAKQQVVCGSGAGVAVSFLACPTELIKCRLQAQSTLAESTSSTSLKYHGPIDVAKHVFRSEGGLRGLYKGMLPTLAREVPGNGVAFGVYEASKTSLQVQEAPPSSAMAP